ncbi:hypothetical protein [Pseudonocardia sp. GCM10023141]|uniref:hypothetical protein n=1 Tax=Pseudonocardia sp. GCM10023141 TaxID=3252653 RepID=UPI00360A3416
MPERPSAVLRLEPHQIPALRAAFADAAASVAQSVTRLRSSGYVTTPWMGDPVSETVRTIYNNRALDGPDSAYQHLSSYHDELMAVVRTLDRMQADYGSTEGTNAALWERQA